MTKRGLAEELIKTLNGGGNNSDTKVSIPLAMVYIGQARDALIKEVLYANYSNWGEFDVPNDLLSEYIISLDGKTESDLPASIIGDLYQDMGLHHVSYLNDEENAFAILKSGWKSMFTGMESANLEGRIGCYVQSNKIIFTEKINGDLMIRMIASSKDIKERDFFPIPSGMEGEVVVRAMALAQVAMQTTEDNKTDNEAVRVR